MKEMKKEIKMPGFTAEASVYKSSGCYYMVGGHGSNTRPVVGLAKQDPMTRMSPMIGWWPTQPWGSSSSFLECAGECRSTCGPEDFFCMDFCILMHCIPV